MSSSEEERGGWGYEATSRAMRGGTMNQQGSMLGLQGATTLPLQSADLRHAATMPSIMDMETSRPCCGGLWKLKQSFGFFAGVLCAMLACYMAPMNDYPMASRMLGITVLCGFFWVFEVMPIYITSLLPLILIPFCGITSSDIVAKSYWNQIQLLVISTYLVDLALEEVNLPRRTALKLLLKTGVVQPGLLLFSFMAMCYVLSMFCNSIAVTLMIAPFAISLMGAAEEQVRNMVQEDADTSSESGEDAVDGFTRDLQKFADGLLLGIAYSATCGGIATLTGAIPNEILIGVPGVADSIDYRSWMCFAFPTSLVTFCAAYFVIYTRYVRGLKLPPLTHEILEIEYEELLKEIGPFSRDEALVGFLLVSQFTLLFLRPILSDWLTTPYGEALIGDSTLACLPAVFLFVLPSVVRPGQSLLTWSSVHDKFNFGLILLIGGGYAISDGFTQSGLNIALGHGVATVMESHSPLIVTLFIVAMCAISAQVFSAIGTASTLLPALNAAAISSLHHPLGLLLPATVACSFAFALPTASPGNVIVLAKSQDLPRALRTQDFVRTGVPLTLIAIVVGSILIYLMEGIVVDADDEPFPKWGCDGVSCVWVDVPGTVQGGHVVVSQACRVVDINVTRCMIWNRTILPISQYMSG